MSRIPFQKPALNIAGQIDLLRRRGMEIADQARAERCLRFIGYYRLSGYWIPFQCRNDSQAYDDFRPGADFEAVLHRHVFDRRLRVLVLPLTRRGAAT